MLENDQKGKGKNKKEKQRTENSEAIHADEGCI
jgi:hypothetical protein